MSEERQRIDKWLWHARVVRTRNAAAALAISGHVRVNGARVTAPGRAIRPGDFVTVALDRTVRVLKVIGFAPRRGSAEHGRALYEELSPKPDVFREPPVPALREPGTGRPTRRERRKLALFKEPPGGDA